MASNINQMTVSIDLLPIDVYQPIEDQAVIKLAHHTSSPEEYNEIAAMLGLEDALCRKKPLRLATSP